MFINYSAATVVLAVEVQAEDPVRSSRVLDAVRSWRWSPPANGLDRLLHALAILATDGRWTFQAIPVEAGRTVAEVDLILRVTAEITIQNPGRRRELEAPASSMKAHIERALR
jgi:hypothetical protein